MPLIEIPPDARKGKPGCGECRLQPGETCDICGAHELERIVDHRNNPLSEILKKALQGSCG
jgi:hypothetical protein